MVAVHKELRGSLSTISKYYRQWRETKGASALPSSPPDALSAAFEAALSRRCADKQSAFDVRLEELNSETELLREALASSEEENSALATESAEARDQSLVAKGENGVLRDRIASLETEKADLIKRVTEFGSAPLSAADVVRAVTDCLTVLKGDLAAAVREAVMSAFQELAGKGGLSHKPEHAASSRRRSGKGEGAPAKASPGKPGGSSGG
jgi:hypothetical protein